ncbi:hypothetical protein DFQ28_008940 [Apophysomyces sp. BC1034]|nr:hypothetical protein DFQ30_008603 [Apophysomyces sp. BC1015]KAG0174198.1 hypothetical protein DFQ29_007560 [Apophysomyces sp. BC1021]KAG0185715.1 hypothetical protein DFQ28_008940 [Apophysomyces sp. BC1034]
MSTDSVTVDFARLSFNAPSNPAGFVPKTFGPTDTHLSAETSTTNKAKATHSEPPHGRLYTRMCIPSDDEDDDADADEGDESSDEDDEDIVGTLRPQPANKKTLAPTTPSAPMRKSQPLPSDGEDSDDDENGSLSKLRLARASPGERAATGSTSSVTSTPYDHNRRLRKMRSDSSTNSVNSIHLPQSLSVPASGSTEELSQYDADDDDDNEVLGQQFRYMDASHLQHMQQYQQAQLAQFQYHQSYAPYKHAPSHLRKSLNQTVPRAAMSGMDLLMQREQEKADAKRQKKPKINPSAAKIEGLLAKLPEPGAHNISFQQVQQQQNSGMGSKYPKKHRLSQPRPVSHDFQRATPPTVANDRRSHHLPYPYGYPVVAYDPVAAMCAHPCPSPSIYQYPYPGQINQVGNILPRSPTSDVFRPGNSAAMHDYQHVNSRRSGAPVVASEPTP